MVRVEQFLADQVAARGDAPALSDSTGVRWTYKMFDKASDDIAQALKDAGVQPNDRVLMLSENCAAAVATVFGTWKAGAVIIPVNARQSAGEIQRIIDHAAPAAVLMTCHASPDATAHAERLGAAEITGAFGAMHLATRSPATPMGI